MTSLVLGRNEEVAAWVDLRLGQKPSGGQRVAIGVERDGQIIAGVVYNGFRGDGLTARTCTMAVAADDPRWCTRGNLRAFFAYPFVSLGCRRVNAIVARKNRRARKLVEGLGFRQEGKIRQLFPDDDGMMYGMLADECKWVNGHG